MIYQEQDKFQYYLFFDLQINWTSEIINDVNIEFSSDGMNTWEVVESSLPAEDLSYTWFIPNIDSDNCFLRLTSPGLVDLYSVNQTPFVIAETVGIEHIEDTYGVRLAVFPNPVTDVATLQYSVTKDRGTNYKIEIYNTDGSMVYNKSGIVDTFGNKYLEINLQALDAGVYIIKYLGEKNQASSKFVKK